MSPSEELRKKLKTLGIRASRGYRMPDGHRTNEDNVTTAWPVYNDPFSTLTFSEEDGSLICEDSLSVDQCVAAVLAADKRSCIRQPPQVKYLRHQKPDTWERIIEDALAYKELPTDMDMKLLVARCKKLAGDAE